MLTSRQALMSGGHDVIVQARDDLQLVVFLPTDLDLANPQARHDLFNDALKLVDGVRNAFIVDQRWIGQWLGPCVHCHLSLCDRQDFSLTHEDENGGGTPVLLQCGQLVDLAVLGGVTAQDTIESTIEHEHLYILEPTVAFGPNKDFGKCIVSRGALQPGSRAQIFVHPDILIDIAAFLDEGAYLSAPCPVAGAVDDDFSVSGGMREMFFALGQPRQGLSRVRISLLPKAKKPHVATSPLLFPGLCDWRGHMY